MKPKITLIKNDKLIEETRFNLKKLYDVINEIGRDLSKRNVDISSYFYSSEQYKKILKENKNLI
ncbi:MAG: hypothetical protein IJN13_00295 [Bacilli bacterium]|nr:hypothetical protein [Bacilli bacterium]